LPPVQAATGVLLFPSRPGDILNLRDLEQGLEQMKRLSSQDVDMQIIPGDAPGGSIIEIAVKNVKPWQLVLSLDDSGSKATGRQQYSGTFALENLLGQNDLFNIAVNSDADQAGAVKGSRGDSFYYSLPRGYWTFTLSGYRNQYHQTVESLSERFRYSGKSDSLELTAEKLVYRDQTKKTSLAASLIKNNSQSYVDDTEIGVQRRKTTAAKLALTHRQYLGQTTLDAGLSWKRGDPRLGTGDDPEGVSGASYSVWVVDTMLSTPVTILQTAAQYSLAVKLQYSRDRLPGNELFSIGNRYTVRGFDGEQTLMAEKGWYLRNELALPLAAGSQMYLGLDCGRISGPSAGDSAGQTLAGAVVGLRGSWQNLQYEVFAGRPLRKPAQFDTASTVFGFHATYSL
jgi:hemolysin activation/secretion protein